MGPVDAAGLVRGEPHVGERHLRQEQGLALPALHAEVQDARVVGEVVRRRLHDRARPGAASRRRGGPRRRRASRNSPRASARSRPGARPSPRSGGSDRRGRGSAARRRPRSTGPAPRRRGPRPRPRSFVSAIASPPVSSGDALQEGALERVGQPVVGHDVGRVSRLRDHDPAVDVCGSRPAAGTEAPDHLVEGTSPARPLRSEPAGVDGVDRHVRPVGLADRRVVDASHARRTPRGPRRSRRSTSVPGPARGSERWRAGRRASRTPGPGPRARRGSAARCRRSRRAPGWAGRPVVWARPPASWSRGRSRPSAATSRARHAVRRRPSSRSPRPRRAAPGRS